MTTQISITVLVCIAVFCIAIISKKAKNPVKEFKKWVFFLIVALSFCIIILALDLRTLIQ